MTHVIVKERVYSFIYKWLSNEWTILEDKTATPAGLHPSPYFARTEFSATRNSTMALTNSTGRGWLSGNWTAPFDVL